jgi:hypothetical protein
MQVVDAKVRFSQRLLVYVSGVSLDYLCPAGADSPTAYFRPDSHSYLRARSLHPVRRVRPYIDYIT